MIRPVKEKSAMANADIDFAANNSGIKFEGISNTALATATIISVISLIRPNIAISRFQPLDHSYRPITYTSQMYEYIPIDTTKEIILEQKYAKEHYTGVAGVSREKFKPIYVETNEVDTWS